MPRAPRTFRQARPERANPRKALSPPPKPTEKVAKREEKRRRWITRRGKT
ncbi:MAG: hypothetical protein HYU29_01920 [Chloroflexi bacterium]|nr:hypothetical protein [Chloroflexota bacterium]